MAFSPERLGREADHLLSLSRVELHLHSLSQWHGVWISVLFGCVYLNAVATRRMNLFRLSVCALCRLCGKLKVGVAAGEGVVNPSSLAGCG
jgi:hypothetical protein